MRNGTLAGLLFGLAFITGEVAYAAPITFSFSGAVTDDPYGLAAFGAPIIGSYTFDAAAVDSIAASGTGSYRSTGPSYGFTADVNGTAYSLPGLVTVTTANNIGVDQYGVIADDGVLALELFLEDAAQSALSSDALPLAALSLSNFEVRQFRLFSPDAEFLGTVDTLACIDGCVAGVPEPNTLGLLGLGFAAFILRRRLSAGLLLLCLRSRRSRC